MKWFLILTFLLTYFTANAQSNSTYIKGPTLYESISRTVSSGVALNLLSGSNTNQEITGTSNQTVNLPNATTLNVGRVFDIKNSSTGTLTLNDSASGLVATLKTQRQARVILYDNSTSAGSWMLETPISQLVDLTTEVTGVLPIANGGTNKSSYTTDSVIFFDGTALEDDPTEFEYDSTTKTLELGDQTVLTGDVHGRVRAIAEQTDPIFAVSSSLVGYSDGIFTADSVASVIGTYNVAKASVAATKTLSGGLAGNFSAVSRSEIGDDGTVDLATGYLSTLSHGNSASKVTNSYSGFLVGFSNVDSNANQIVNMYDFLAMPNTIAAGAVTNRFGIYIGVDSGYTKQNWISGDVLIGGTSFSSPQASLDVQGDIKTTNSIVIEDAGIGTNTVTVESSSPLSSSYTLTLPPNDGTANQFLQTDGSGVLSFETLDLATDVTGVLPIANGGTNSSSALNNDRVIISSGSAIVEHSAITASRALESNASGLPVASSVTSTELGYVAGVTSAIQTQINSKITSPADLTTQVTGVLPIANGGTNNSSAYTSGSVIFSNGTSLTENNSKLFWDNTNFRLGINNTSPSRSIGIRTETADSTAGINIANYNDSASGLTSITQFKSRGTIASPTAIQSSDILGSVGFNGHNGTAFQTVSPVTITALANETFTTSAAGSYMIFQTTGNGTLTRKTRMRINHDGGIQLNGDTSGSLILYPAATTTSYNLVLPFAQGSSNSILLNDGSGNLSWNTSTYALASLSNLASVAINTSLISDTNNTDDLGSDSIEWKDLWVHGIKHDNASAPDLQIFTNGNNGNVSLEPHGTGIVSATKAIKSLISFILEDPGAGTNTITVQAPTLSGNYTLTMPTDDGNSNQVLTTNGSGTLSWTDHAAGTISTDASSDRIMRVRVANSGTASIKDQSGEVASVTRNSSGNVTVNITSGKFSSAPTCNCTSYRGGLANACYIDSNTTPSATAVRFQVANDAGGAEDRDFDVICLGPK